MFKIKGESLHQLEPPVPAVIGECALHVGRTDTCLDEDSSRRVVAAVGASDIEEAKRKVGCDSEKCLVQKSQVVLGNSFRAIIANYKVDGPTDAKLLSNVNIDSVLDQWAQRWSDFYHYNFNMLDYAKYRFQSGRVIDEPDSLATVKFAELYKQGQYKTCACVINSDKYRNAGEHWMALFADARAEGKATVEFFNSSGGPPAPEFVSWLVKTQTGLRLAGIKQVEVITVCQVRHQKSMSECGVYSLFYIWARLNGVPYTYFMKNKIPDAMMFEFRQHLFANPTAVKDGQFNWEEFQRVVRPKWN